MRFIATLIMSILMIIGIVPASTAADAERFTVAVIPDTQFSAQQGTSTFERQTRWLAENKDRLGLKFVLHEGDIVEDVCDPAQWAYADRGMDVLEASRIPYAISPGNHDIIGYAPCPVVRQFVTDPYNQTFPLSRAKAQPGYGGAFDSTGLNTYYTFSAAGTSYLVISLQFGPSVSQVDWARNVAAKFPNHHAIVLTHDLISPDGTLRGSDLSVPALPSLPGQQNGQQIWDRFIKRAPNVQFTFNGHVTNATPNGTVGYSEATNDAGRTVHRMLANYQDVTAQGGLFGDAGFIRLLTFETASDTVSVRTYSPTLDTYLTDPSNQFFINADLSSGTPAVLPTTTLFRDVTRSHPFFMAIETLYRAGITTGYADGTYRPSNNISREAAAAMVYRASPGADTSASTCAARGIRAPFVDVSANHPFCFAIHSLKEKGQLGGWPDGTFRPSEPVSRQAFVAFMFPRGTVTQSSFSDVDPNNSLAGPIESAKTLGITTGYPDGTFRPSQTISREGAGAMLARYYFFARG